MSQKYRRVVVAIVDRDPHQPRPLVVMEMASESGRVVALDLVEVNPTLDLRNTTAELGTELALSAMGKQIL